MMEENANSNEDLLTRAYKSHNQNDLFKDWLEGIEEWVTDIFQSRQ